MSATRQPTPISRGQVIAPAVLEVTGFVVTIAFDTWVKNPTSLVFCGLLGLLVGIAIRQRLHQASDRAIASAIAATALFLTVLLWLSVLGNPVSLQVPLWANIAMYFAALIVAWQPHRLFTQEA